MLMLRYNRVSVTVGTAFFLVWQFLFYFVGLYCNCRRDCCIWCRFASVSIPPCPVLSRLMLLRQEAPLEPLVVIAGAANVLSKDGFFAGK